MTDEKGDNTSTLWALLFSSALLIIAFLWLRDAARFDLVCESAIAGFSDNRQLGLFLTTNPGCASELKISNWNTPPAPAKKK